MNFDDGKKTPPRTRHAPRRENPRALPRESKRAARLPFQLRPREGAAEREEPRSHPAPLISKKRGLRRGEGRARRFYMDQSHAHAAARSLPPRPPTRGARRPRGERQTQASRLVERLLLVRGDRAVARGVGDAREHEAVAHLGVVEERLVRLVDRAALDLARARRAGACLVGFRGSG